MKLKIQTSKLLTLFAIIQYIITLIISVIAIFTDRDFQILYYLIPASSAVCAATLGFYFNKSKTENLSKQKIRNIYLKLLLEDKLDADSYLEIEETLSNIDELIEDKLTSELQESVNEKFEIEK